MDPEQSAKGTKKAEGSPRKRLTKGEAIQTSVTSSVPYVGSTVAATQESPPQELLAPQPFPGPSSVLREGSQEKTGQPQKPPKRSSVEASVHITQLPQHPLTPAFLSPGKPEHLLEGATWQLVDPMRPGPSGSFVAPGLHPQGQLLPPHASILPAEDLPGIPKVFVPRPTQVTLKPTEEAPKKERKPQKPGKYICQYCSRPCAKPSVLQKHIRSHTGERPYPCGPCGFSFKTKSNLYKHRKSHAHRIKAGLASGMGSEMYPPGLELERLPGEEFEEPTEGESTDSEEETGATSSHSAELSPRLKHPLLTSGLYGSGSHSSSHERCSLSQSSTSQSLEDPSAFAEPSSEHPQSHKPEDTHTIKQKLALRLSERKKVIDEQAFLSPGSKGSTESGYFSRSESAEQQASPPNTNAKSYAEIILGKCGRIGQRTTMLATATSTQPLLPLSTEDKPSLVPLSVPRTQVIEHITKLITINEAVVDTSEIDSVKPRRSSLSRRSSMESPKSSLYRESLLPHGEKQSMLSLQHPPSTTPPVPLLRSHSMPSATCTLSTPHPTFRGSYSFDDHIAESTTLSRSSQAFTSHPRMLKRQPAIELPLGGEYSCEEAGPSSKEAASKPSDEPEPKESELTKKTKKGLKTKGAVYECNVCGARYKKRDNYEAHKKYYCSELQTAKPTSTGAHVPPEAEKGQAEHEPWSQMMHYKLGTTLELTPLRKRRKEKSLGDEEEPPPFESTKSQFGGTGPSEATRNLPLESTKSPAEPSKSGAPLEGVPSFQPRTPKQGSGSESGKERRTTSKEISVIQHTSSFEKSDSLEQPGGLEGEEKPLTQFSSSQTATSSHVRPPHSLQPKLVRQPNIQVPEILVTEEPDRPDTEPEPPPKEPEKTEEFQWPQRSQTLAQLPAEKLPPKKKRLRLAEMAQSSGESSFESSLPLSRSPSQESSISLSGSSHSASFERDEHGKGEAPGPSSDTRPKPLGTHMLTVPSHHSHAREMRRSASEQSPNISHSTHMAETRSKSFDYGSLSSGGPPVLPGPVALPAPAAPPPERRKCFLVRQASLSRPPEAELEATPKARPESEEPQLSSSGKPPTKGPLPQICSVGPSHSGNLGGKGQLQDRPPRASPLPYTEALQVLHHPIAQLPLPEKPYMPPPVSLFSFQHLLQHEPGQSSDFFSTQAMSSLLSSPYSMPPLPPSLFQAPPLPLQPTVLHPGQLHLPQLIPHPANIPFRQPPSFLPMPYPTSSALSSGFFLPLQSQFTLQLPGDVESHRPLIKTSLAPLVTGTTGLSSSTEYSSDIQLSPAAPTASSSAPTSGPPLALPACPDSMVSLVVPVRIQTNMPSYGSAMYTTLSQILVTQSPGTTATASLAKFEEPLTKGTGAHGAGVYDVEPGPSGLNEEQRFPTPYLRVPMTLSERKGPSLSSESVLSPEGSASTVGGSKRVLSPAGSLELTMETQQQKRVKEEEASKAEDNLELVKPCSVVLTSTEERKKPEKSQVGSQGQSRRELETLSSLSPDPADPKEVPPLPHPTLPHGTGSGSEALKEYGQPSSKPHRRGLPLLSVKKEDAKEQADLPPLAPPSSLPLSETPPRPAKSQEGMDSKKVLQFPSLHTTTNVSWCYLNYIKPNHIQHADRRSSVYAGWCISLYNPNLPGVSTKAALSLLRSKQKVSKETYTMATAPHPEAGRLVPSSSRKPRMTEVHLPSLVSPEGQKDVARVEKEEDQQGKPEEDAPASKRGEPARIKIFEGGYKSNEEYVYVRGRGRGKYVCEECGIRCKKPSMLKKHIRTHTDVRPYVCKHCHFAFKTKGNLTKHMKSKAHSKKCQETGVLEELEAEEGTSDDLFQDPEGREGSEVVEEHQFSDLEGSDSDTDLDEDEDEDEDESQDEVSRPSTEAPLPGPVAPLRADSSPLPDPQPTDVTQSSWVSEAEYLAASTCSLSHQSTLCLPQPGLAPTGPVEKDTGPTLNPKAMSPRQPWSPSKETGGRTPLTRKHSLTKNNSSSPQRWSPAQEPQALTLSPSGLRTGSRDMGPLSCGSPRLELSPIALHPLGRPPPPRVHLPPEPEGTPGPLRHSPTSRWSLGQAASPPRSVLPGEWALAGPGSPSAGECGPGLGPAPRVLLPPAPLPHKLLGRSSETCASTWKSEPRSPSCSPGPARLFCSRPFSASHDFRNHTPARPEENIFSHLPLHSQHLPRTPCPLIPIGGIQMVQARPGAHPTLLPGSIPVAWVSGFSGGGSDLTGAREAQERSRWSPTESSSASVSPVAKVSKFTLSSELEGRHYPRERERTGGGLGRPPDWELQGAKAPPEPAHRHSPCVPSEASPLAALSQSPHGESLCTPTRPEAPAMPALDRSSSVGCLAEASTHFPGRRRRNLSGEPRTRQGSPDSSGSKEPRAPPPQPEDRGPPIP